MTDIASLSERLDQEVRPPMPGTVPAAPGRQPGRDDLTTRVFRALYHKFDVCTIGDTYLVFPKGTSWFAGRSLGDIARQISEHEHVDQAAPSPGTTADSADTGQAS